MIKNCFPKGNSGFTLVEILVTIGLIGILAGVTFSLVNPKKHQDDAEDGVRQASLGRLVLGLEAYLGANGTYPLESELTDADNNGKPDGSEAAAFVAKLPSGATYTYTASADRASFEVSVPDSKNSGACYKYKSSWGKIKKCAVCTSEECAALDVSPTVVPTLTPIPSPTPLPTSTPTPSPTPAPLYLVKGWIDVQGRANDSGVTVTYTSGSNVYTATTASGGGFSASIPAGDYTIVADKPLYLSRRLVTTIAGAATLSTSVLPGGDANGDGTVSSLDADLINAQYGKGCAAPGFDPRADINGDCIVDILDLSLYGGNFGKTEPLAW